MVLWAFFTYVGYDLAMASAQRHVPGFPSADQWHYYVHFPLVMLLMSTGQLLLARKLPRSLFVAIWGLQIVLFLPFHFGYMGGM